MDKKKFRKKMFLIISSIATIVLLASVVSVTLISNPVENKNQTSNQGKDKYGKVNVSDKVVTGTVIVKDSTNDDDAAKLGDSYTKELQKKYPDKQVVVKVSDKQGFVTNVTGNYNPNISTGSVATGSSELPKATIRIGKGVLDFDRLIVVTLDTPNPERYSVTVLNEKLKYFADRKIFQQVIEETDENKIKNNLKIELT